MSQLGPDFLLVAVAAWHELKQSKKDRILSMKVLKMSVFNIGIPWIYCGFSSRPAP